MLKKINLNTAQILTSLFNLILLLVLVRFLGVSQFGLFSFALSISATFLAIGRIGTHYFIPQNTGQNYSNELNVVEDTLPVLTIFSIICLLTLNFLSVVLEFSNHERSVIFLSSLYIFFKNYSTFFSISFKKSGKIKSEAYLDLLEKLGLVVIALIVWLNEFYLTTLLQGFLLTILLRGSLSFYLLDRELKIHLNFNWRIFKQTIRILLPSTLILFFTVISFEIDIIMLKIIHSNSMAGFYSAGRWIVESITIIPYYLSFLFVPVLLNKFRLNKREFGLLFEINVRVLFIIAIPIVLIIYSLSPNIVDVILYKQFEETKMVIQLLSFALGILFFRYLIFGLLNGLGFSREIVLITAVGMVINTTLNFILIPDYYLWGAAVATVISEIIIAVFSLSYMRDKLTGNIMRNVILKIIFIIVVIISIYNLIDIQNTWLFLSLMIGIFSILVFIMNFISMREIKNYLELTKSMNSNH